MISYPSALFHGYAHPWKGSNLLQGDITTIVDNNNMKEVEVVRPLGGIAPSPAFTRYPNLSATIANSPIEKSNLTKALYKYYTEGAKALTEKEMELITNSKVSTLSESFQNDIARLVKASLAARNAIKLKAIDAFKATQKLPVRNFVPAYTPEDLSGPSPWKYGPMYEPNNNGINLEDLYNNIIPIE